MKGVDLESWCKQMGGENGGCPDCPVSKKCAKWKADLKKLSQMEPWELENFITLTGEMVHGKEY